MSNTASQLVWNGLNLEDLRQIMDPPADDAVLSVYNSGQLTELRNLLTALATNDSALPDVMPKTMKDFINGELQRPFTDHDVLMFQQAHEIWRKHGTNFIFVLFFRALPYTYMAEKPAHVLTMSQLLVKEPARRVIETAQFVFDVMDKDWWMPGKRGILTALKVRIMHAAMRHVLLNNKTGEQWDEAWGKPISQEDLIATNQVFSLEFFKGMEMLGKPLSAAEQAAWFHTWKTIGSIMGIQDNLLCITPDEAWTLQHSIYEHLFTSDSHQSGAMLVKSLVDTMSRFHMSEKMSLILMRKMLADSSFPDCFEKMLGPDFEIDHPELFHKPAESEKAGHEAMLNDVFRTHLKDMIQKVQAYSRELELKIEDKNFLDKLLNMLKSLFSKPKTGSLHKHIIQIHVNKAEQSMQTTAQDTAVQKAEEFVIEDSMSAIGGMVVGVLTVFFRPGKNSGFRIPADLQELWASEGVK